MAVDEVSYSDPGINLALGNGFITTAWYSQTADQLFVSNSPLYPLLLGGWLRLVGFSLVSVRLLNPILSTLALFIAWLASRRLGLITTSAGRLLFVTLVGTGMAMVFVFRLGRYDTLMLLLFVLAVAAFSVRSAGARHVSLFLLGVLFPLAGLPLIAFAAVLSLFLLIWCGTSVFPALAATGLGAAFGAASYFVWLRMAGAWPTFFSAVAPHIAYGFQRPELCPSWLMVCVLLFSASLALWHAGMWHLRSLSGFGLVAGVTIPFVIAAIGHFPISYYWMAYVPATAGLSAAIEKLWPRIGRSRRIAVGVGIAAAVLLGFPAYLGIVAIEWDQRSYAPVQRLVDRTVNADDWVYCDWSAYYAAKQRARAVFLPGYAIGWEAFADGRQNGGAPIPAEVRDRVTVVITRPESSRSVLTMLGGSWRDEGTAEVAPIGKTLPLPFGRTLGSAKCRLVAYSRRETQPTAVQVGTTEMGEP